MLQKYFSATTKSGKVITLDATNTETKLVTTYPTQQVVTGKNKKGQYEYAYVIVLTPAQAKELLGVTLPPTQKEAGIKIDDQNGWEEFKKDCTREQIAERENRLERLFPGLALLQEARANQNRYDHAFERMMEDEQNDGVNPPTPVKKGQRYQDLAPQYTKAVAYLKAEGYAYSSHYAKAGAGKLAMQRMESGEDCEQVLAAMEAEWHAAVDEAMRND